MTPRKFLWLMLLGLAMWAGIIYGGCKAKDAFAASPYQACDYAVSFPVRIHIGAGVDPAPWRAAIAEWDRHYPGSFEESPEGVPVVLSESTWVEMPCGREAVIHSGHDVRLDYWAAHELAHVLGIRDFIQAGVNPAGYINPGTCPGSYSGIASYCTPREAWFGPGDDAMMRSLGYRWRLRVAF